MGLVNSREHVNAFQFDNQTAFYEQIHSTFTDWSPLIRHLELPSPFKPQTSLLQFTAQRFFAN